MKKRVRGLSLSRETLRDLLTPARNLELLAVVGGTCGTSHTSDMTKPCCPDVAPRVPEPRGRRSPRARRS